VIYDRRGQAGLPEGPPSAKGLSLDDSIPGYKTFAKPEDAPPRKQDGDDESIYRVDNAEDKAKEQSRPDERNLSAPFSLGTFGLKSAHYVAEASQLGPQIRVATKLGEIEQGLNPAVQERAQSCSALLVRADIPNLTWQFVVKCGGKPKVVRMKAVRKGKTTKLTLMDLSFSCSCPAWRWLGSEHHAKREEYLKGKPVGTASTPIIRDPEGINRVCKHVYAVIGTVRKWQLSSKPK
jgi:hypothetical protein